MDVRARWSGSSSSDLAALCDEFGLTHKMAEKYIGMTDEEVQAVLQPRKMNRKTPRKGDSYVNIIYKMMADGYADDKIYYYLRHIGIADKTAAIWFYLECISANNFPERKRMLSSNIQEKVYPEDVIVINRSSLVKYILTADSKKTNDKKLSEHIDALKECYPVIGWGMEAFQCFHSALMGDVPEEIDAFIADYKDSELKVFCESLQRDIEPVKNAVIYDVSSGFVEGNNNKFKLVKRIVYGRSGLVNLERKCKLAFLPKQDDFSIANLI